MSLWALSIGLLWFGAMVWLSYLKGRHDAIEEIRAALDERTLDAAAHHRAAECKLRQAAWAHRLAERTYRHELARLALGMSPLTCQTSICWN